MIVPGSGIVKEQAEAEGLDKIFVKAGFEWREPGCSMCLAMNPDKLEGREICASSSNRNFKGRQGSPTGRTLLMLLRHALSLDQEAIAVEGAIGAALNAGHRTADLAQGQERKIGTKEMTDVIVRFIQP